MAMRSWNETATRLTHTTDTREKKIDPGILETVAALHMLNFCTTASCEGQSDWGIAAPWIDIDPPGDDRETLRDQMRIAPKEEARKMSDPLKIKQCVLFQSISKLLDQFYGPSRGHIPYDHILIPHMWAAGRIRIESIGLEMQTVVPEDRKAQKLLEYRQEMQDFTTFLRPRLESRLE